MRVNDKIAPFVKLISSVACRACSSVSYMIKVTPLLSGVRRHSIDLCGSFGSVKTRCRKNSPVRCEIVLSRSKTLSPCGLWALPCAVPLPV